MMLSVRRFSVFILFCVCFSVVKADSRYRYSSSPLFVFGSSQTGATNSIENVSNSVVRFEDVNQTTICFSAIPSSFDCSILAELTLSGSISTDAESTHSIDTHNPIHAFERLFLANISIDQRLEKDNVVYDVASQNIYAVDFKNENAQAVEQDPDGNPNEHSHENYISTYVEQSDASVVTDSINTIQYSDSDNDGIPDILESDEDSDDDSLPNYLDFDSDNDGISDSDEAGILYRDSDRDGLDDRFDIHFSTDLDEKTSRFQQQWNH